MAHFRAHAVISPQKAHRAKNQRKLRCRNGLHQTQEGRCKRTVPQTRRVLQLLKARSCPRLWWRHRALCGESVRNLRGLVKMRSAGTTALTRYHVGRAGAANGALGKSLSVTEGTDGVCFGKSEPRMGNRPLALANQYADRLGCGGKPSVLHPRQTPEAAVSATPRRRSRRRSTKHPLATANGSTTAPRGS
jgi:hypothetical protein